MKKLSHLIMTGLTFAALQAAMVEAQMGDSPGMPPMDANTGR